MGAWPEPPGARVTGARTTTGLALSRLGDDSDLDLVYELFDERLRAGHFENCDANLFDVYADAEALPTHVLLGVLIASYAARDMLPCWRMVRRRTENVARTRGELEPGLFDGLE